MKETIAFVGRNGMYCEAAAHQLCGVHAAFAPCETLDTIVRSVERGDASAGVVPIENSTEGSVHRTLDLLTQAALIIQRETMLPIRHQLLGKAQSLQDVREVWA